MQQYRARYKIPHLQQYSIVGVILFFSYIENIKPHDMAINFKLIQYHQKIIKDYGAALAGSPKGVIARKMSTLHDSKDAIVMAYEIYVSNMKNHLSDDDIIGLKTAFLAINQFVPDDMADILNSVHTNKATASEGHTQLYNAFQKVAYLNPGPELELFNSYLT